MEPEAQNKEFIKIVKPSSLVLYKIAEFVMYVVGGMIEGTYQYFILQYWCNILKTYHHLSNCMKFQRKYPIIRK